jgi:hypothetical protein
MTAIGVVLALVVAGIVVLYVRHMVRTHGAGPLAWRFFSGHHLDGKYRTDATWIRGSTKVLHPTGRVVGWHHLPRLVRAAIRVGAVLMIVAVIYGLVTMPGATLWALAAAGAVLLALAALWAFVKVRAARHRWKYVTPTARALTATLGVPPASLTIARDLSQITVGLPPELTGAETDRAAIERAVTSKLAIEPPDARWQLSGRKPTVTFTQTAPPPELVTLAMLGPAIRGSGPNDVVAGLGRRNTAVPISLDNDSAHIAMSIGPGGGKTLAARALAIQVLHKGGLVIVLNFKKSGYNWTRGLPNVCHAKTIEDIGDALIWANVERNRREDVAEAEGDIEDELPEHVNVGPRILVIFEEQNLTVPKIKAQRPDAFEALGDLNFAGRAARLNMVAIAQRYSAKAAGGGDVRAAVNARLLGRYDKDSWQMLAKAFPMPTPNSTPGRVQVVTDEVREAQMPKISGQEAHDFALSGTVALCPADMPARCAVGYVPASQVGNSPPDLRLSQGQGVPELPPSRLIGLAEAVDDGVTSLSLAAVRKRTQRDPSFPAVRGHRGAEALYSETELIAWEDSR